MIFFAPSSDLRIMRHCCPVIQPVAPYRTLKFPSMASAGRVLGNVVVHDALNVMTGASNNFIDCPLLHNQTLCPELHNKSSFTAVVYNPQPRRRNVVIRLPWHGGPGVPAVLCGGKVVPSAVVPAAPFTPVQQAALLPEGSGADSDQAQLVFTADLGALSASTFDIRPIKAIAAQPLPPTPTPGAADPQTATQVATTIENEMFRVTIDAETGLLASVTSKTTNVSTTVAQRFYFYEAAMIVSETGPPLGHCRHCRHCRSSCHMISLSCLIGPHRASFTCTGMVRQ